MDTPESMIIDTMHGAVHEMDLALGRRMSAMVISGAAGIPHRGISTHESPQYLTSRVMVAPMIRTLGYTDMTEIRREMERVSGLVIAITSVNHPLREASENLLHTMKLEHVGLGVATDGIRWVLAEMYGRRPKIVSMTDLRPYYVEVLDRDRFRVAVREDRRNLRLFSRLYSRQDQLDGCPQGSPSGEPTSMSSTTDE